jgi:hypothetical protein
VLELQRGATGFRHISEPELPEVDVRRFRAGCYAAARAAHTVVDRIVERTYPETFHFAVLAGTAASVRILCHLVHPWIAFVEEGTGNWLDPGVFREPPVWAAEFTREGFTVLSAELLDSPLRDSDTAALAAAEWSQIHSWEKQLVGQSSLTLGQTLFNSWD